MEDIKYLVWLNHIFEPGTKKITQILDFFGTARNAFNSEYLDLKASMFLTENDIKKIISSKREFDIDACMENLLKKNILIVSKNCKNYPSLLKNTDNPPEILYYIGEIPPDNLIKISIIGSRESTQYGRTMANKLGRELASKNVVVVSGMARGIDAATHQGAIDGGEKTIAVLGTGVDVCYPLENFNLYEKISQGSGCIISEYPPETTAKPRFFPVRNRIVAGLSDATIVVESGKKSGTSITVGYALDFGREVFAVPGQATSPYSVGTNQLIKEGAALVTSAQDVLDFLGIIESEQGDSLENIKKSLAPNEKLIYEFLNHNPISIDEIKIRSNMDIKDIQFALTTLEIKRIIKRLPGQQFIKT
ncbi:MAG: DNA-processing protein DprA [Defluviitaleaceae bacterium]|nr:DNA-processing protein DprA [Defluviitaleaceae bacterium]